MLTLIAAIATLSGLVAAMLPAIQITKMLRSRCSNGISIAYIAGGLANNVIWTVYGFAIPNLALIIPDVLTVAMNLTMLTVAIRYRPARRSSRETMVPTPAGRELDHGSRRHAPRPLDVLGPERRSTGPAVVTP